MLGYRHKIILIATIFAICLTSLVYIIPKYSVLWLTLEVIILPVIYMVGYENLMNEQEKLFDEDTTELIDTVESLEKENFRLKEKMKKLT